MNTADITLMMLMRLFPEYPIKRLIMLTSIASRDVNRIQQACGYKKKVRYNHEKVN